MKKHYKTAIEAAVKAGLAILEIYESTDNIVVEHKPDDSPLTNADRVANEVIQSYLATTGIPVISEESKQMTYAVRKDWKQCWIVDPLDGTKEFIKRNGEFTVNIAFCVDGRPEFGVIYVPVSRELYYGWVSENMAFKTVMDEEHQMPGALAVQEDRIAPSPESKSVLRVVGSRSHMNADTEAFIEASKKKYGTVEIVSKGSSLKFCLVAEGKADVYPRFAPTMEWDTAAGSAIAEAAGLSVISQETQSPLKYNKENLLNPFFLVRK